MRSQWFRSLIFCVAAFLAASAVAQQVSAPEPQPASIIGTVVDLDGDTLGGASATLDGPSPADHRSAESNDDGFFRFEALRPGVPYHVSVTAKGFTSWASPAIVLAPGEVHDLKGVPLKLMVVETTVAVATPEEIALQQVKVEEKQRVFGIFPNFYVAYDPDTVALTSKLKFQLAYKAAVDPINFASAAAFAAFQQAGDTPAYGQGVQGYAKRYGADYASSVTGIFIGGAILPSLLHQDPRYFYQGTGTTRSRALHAISTPLWCRGDNGKYQFNASAIFGDLSSAAIANAYLPDKDRGAGMVFSSALIDAGGRIANAVLQEFVMRRFTSGANKKN